MRGACRLLGIGWLLIAVGGGAGAAVAADAAAPAAAAVFAHPASAAQVSALLGPAAAKLRSAVGLRGSFVQRKYLHDLPQPLRSSGDFLVGRGQGVVWHTRKPFDAELLLTPQALIQRSTGGGKPTRVDASQQPGLKAVAEVFDALFALDLDRLGQTFTLFGQADGGSGGWQLGLVPREAALAQRIERIRLSGSGQPRQIVLDEAGGDRTEIDFGDTVVLDTLGEAERRALAAE